MDMGHKMPKPETAAMPMEAKDKMMYPNMYLEYKVPEEMMSKDVGYMGRCEIVYKIVSKSENDKGNSMTLEIHKMNHIADAGKKDFKEYDKMSDENKENYDKEDVEDREEE